MVIPNIPGRYASMMDDSTMTWSTTSTTTGTIGRPAIPTVRYTLCRFPEKHHRSRIYNNYTYIEKGVVSSYGHPMDVYNLEERNQWLRPTIMADKLEVDDISLIRAEEQLTGTPPVLFRLRRYQEIQEQIRRLGITEEHIEEDWNTFKSVIEEEGIHTRYIHDGIFFNQTPMLRTSEDLTPITVFRGRKHNSPNLSLYTDYYDRDKEVRYYNLPIILDYTPTDLVLYYNYIKVQMRARRRRPMTDKLFGSGRDSNYLMGCIAVVDAVVPDPDFILFNYYPRQWEIDAGTRRRLYAFLPSTQGVKNGWVPGIFSPAGNIIPITLFDGKINVLHYITDRPKFMFPFGHSFSYKKVKSKSGTVYTDILVNPQIDVRPAPEFTGQNSIAGDIATLLPINHGQICETCVHQFIDCYECTYTPIATITTSNIPGDPVRVGPPFERADLVFPNGLAMSSIPRGESVLPWAVDSIRREEAAINFRDTINMHIPNLNRNVYGDLENIQRNMVGQINNDTNRERLRHDIQRIMTDIPDEPQWEVMPAPMESVRLNTNIDLGISPITIGRSSLGFRSLGDISGIPRYFPARADDPSEDNNSG